MLLPVCNVSGDGACNSTDALFILQCSVGIHNPFCPAQSQLPAASTQAEEVLDDAMVTIGSATIAVGDSATVPITAILPAGVSLGAFDLTVTFNPALVTATGCTVNAAFVGYCNPTSGQVLFSGISVTGQSGTVQLGQVTFQKLALGVAALTLDVTNFANALGDQIPRTAVHGSIEDPLMVTLSGFAAVVGGDHVLVTWETASEVNTVGFNLYRSDSAEGERALLATVPSQAPGSTLGATYSYEDSTVTAGQTYWYWLEGIDLSGATTLHGPVSVVYQAPTAVALTAISASPMGPMAGPTVLPALAACLAALGAGHLVQRRKR
jgi:hypothetical protein